MLHAFELELETDGGVRRAFVRTPPQDFRDLARQLDLKHALVS
ncbi:MAG: hypothetical protein AAFX94_12090 [Myxococcota bacterium]